MTTNRRLVLGLVRERGRPLEVVVQGATTATRVPLHHLGVYLDGISGTADPGPDTGTSPDTGSETGSDTSPNTGSETGSDTSPNTGSETGSDTAGSGRGGDAGESLRSVDDPSRSLVDMDDTISLRLVIELVNDPSGHARVNLHRFDRSVDYGPVSVYDLPAIIQALAPSHDPTRPTVVDLSDETTNG